MKRHLAALTLIAITTTQGCKSGYNRPINPSGSGEPTPPKCVTAPANSSIDAKTLKVFQLIAGLTCASASYPDIFLSGQSLGYGNEINNRDNLANNDPKNRSYARLIDGFDTATTHKPAVISIDYEYDKLYTQDELLAVNETLEKHWDAGGLITISWTPISPYINDSLDITGKRGSHDDTLFPPGGTLKLADLLDDTTDSYVIWRRKLDAMVTQLRDLQLRGVTVLWRPLPEMNSPTYWWGTQASNPSGNKDGAKLYTDLWKDMYDYFKNAGLNNLLWVYSPAEAASGEAINWAYPGDGYVDVVAGIAQNDTLNINDYDALVKIGKPIGMAQYGPSPTGNFAQSGLGSDRGTFPNTVYADRLRGSYQTVAYWVSNHSDLLNTTTRSNLALVDNLKSKELVERTYIYTVEKLSEKKLLE